MFYILLAEILKEVPIHLAEMLAFKLVDESAKFTKYKIVEKVDEKKAEIFEAGVNIGKKGAKNEINALKKENQIQKEEINRQQEMINKQHEYIKEQDSFIDQNLK